MVDAVASLVVLAGFFGVLAWRVYRHRPRKLPQLRAPSPSLAVVGGSDLALLRARLASAQSQADRAATRAAALLEENLKLAAQLAREARKADEALNKLDEVAQRLRQCTCAVGQAIAAELDELNGIGRV